MAVESATDLANFFDADDFAVVATFTSPALGSVTGIFDEEQVVDEEFNRVRREPRFLCRTSDIPNVTEGSLCTIRAVAREVLYTLDDGTGVTEVYLKNV